MDKNKRIARETHIISEMLTFARMMEKRTDCECIRESLTELGVYIRIKDIPSVLDEVYQRVLLASKTNDMDFIEDRLVQTEKFQKDSTIRIAYEMRTDSPAICPNCGCIIEMGAISCITSEYFRPICEDCFYVDDINCHDPIHIDENEDEDED